MTGVYACGNNETKEKEMEMPKTKEDMKFAGAVIGAMVNQAHGIHNALEANLRAQLRDMQEDFAKLYRGMEKVAQRTDSATAYRFLNQHEYRMEQVERALSVPEKE